MHDFFSLKNIGYFWVIGWLLVIWMYSYGIGVSKRTAMQERSQSKAAFHHHQHKDIIKTWSCPHDYRKRRMSAQAMHKSERRFAFVHSHHTYQVPPMLTLQWEPKGAMPETMLWRFKQSQSIILKALLRPFLLIPTFFLVFVRLYSHTGYTNCEA